MTTDQKDSLRLQHIVEAAQHLSDFINGVSKEEFSANYEKQRAVINQLEVIGEAASKLTPVFRERYRDVDWPRAIGMRHKMIHDYFDIDIDIVWATALDDIPILKTDVEKILHSNEL